MLATRIEGWDAQIFDRLFLMGGRTAFVKRPCSPLFVSPGLSSVPPVITPEFVTTVFPVTPPFVTYVPPAVPPFGTITPPFVTPASAATGGLRTAGAGVLADVVGSTARRSLVKLNDIVIRLDHESQATERISPVVMRGFGLCIHVLPLVQ